MLLLKTLLYFTTSKAISKGRTLHIPIDVSEKISADEKNSLRKMILNMDGTNVPEFILVLPLIFECSLLFTF